MKKAKIIVLAGQSNAVGVGHTQYLNRSFSDDKILEYRRGYETVRIRYYSHDKKSDGFTATTVNCTEQHRDTLGPELGIADYINTHFPDEEIFIVKFAMGGASLMRDYLSPSSGGYYDVASFKDEYRGLVDAFLAGEPVRAGWCYNGLVDILRDSIAEFKDNGLCPEILGFCWMQGESDAGTPEQVDNYKVYFDNFIRDLKQEFAPYLDDCVFADAGISEMWPCYREMNAFKKDYAESHHGFVYVDTIENGLTTRYEPIEEPDTAHYDCGSVIRLGQLFADSLDWKDNATATVFASE